jgi:hypothetical protein
VDIREARLNSDGSCEFYDSVDEVIEGRWGSVAEWALAWFDEWGRETHGPACEFALALTNEAPPGVVDVLVTLAEAANGDTNLLAWIGAGPLEDLVSHYGNGLAVLDDVETAARRSPPFRRALTGVWLSDVPDEVRTRLTPFGPRDFVAERGMTQAQLAAYFKDRRARGWLGQGDDR